MSWMWSSKRELLARYSDKKTGCKKKEMEAYTSSKMETVLSKLLELEQKKQEHKAKCSSPEDRDPAIYRHENTDLEASGPAQKDLATAHGALTSSYQNEASETEAPPDTQSRRREYASSLCDPDMMWDWYFSGVLESARIAVHDIADEDTLADFATSMEVKCGQVRRDYRATTVCSLPIKLFLMPLSRGTAVANTFASLLGMQFGPLHASLKVGNVILEWDCRSLVIPSFSDDDKKTLEIDVQPHSKWVECVRQHNIEVDMTEEDLKYSKEVELIYGLASDKKELIDALIQVIIKYNSYKYYNIIDRNCQHFVSDALDALGVELPKEFTGGLRDYYKALVEGRTPSIPKMFKTHHDLDKYVEDNNIKEMSQNDLEFLLAMYFRIHLERNSCFMIKGCCSEDGCRMNDVECLIKEKALLIHKYRKT